MIDIRFSNASQTSHVYLSLLYLSESTYNLIKKWKYVTFQFDSYKKYTSSASSKFEKLDNLILFSLNYTYLQKDEISLKIHAMPEMHYRIGFLSFSYFFKISTKTE